MWTPERLRNKDYSVEAKYYNTYFNQLVKDRLTVMCINKQEEREMRSETENWATGIIQIMADARNRLVDAGLSEAYPDKEPGRK